MSRQSSHWKCQVYLDGIPLKGEWRGGTRRPNRRGEEVKAIVEISQHVRGKLISEHCEHCGHVQRLRTV